MDDFIIIGAGPAGLTLALILSRAGLKTTIIEKDKIGGCHASYGSGTTFKEHGPRVYSSSYKTSKQILKEIGLNWDDIFKPYLFTISQIGTSNISHLGVWNVLKLAVGYILYPDMSVDEFTKNWSSSNRDYLDRLCRLTDGAGADNFTMYKLGSLVNKEAFYELYQPRNPLNEILWEPFRNYLQQNGVKFIDETVIDIQTSTTVVVSTQNNTYYGKNVIIATPPQSYIDLLPTELRPPTSWVYKTSYIDYHSVSFYWKDKIDIPKKWGFANTENGLIYVVLSDYFDNERGTLISTALTKVDFDKKTNNNQIETIAFEQLQESLGPLPMYESANHGPYKPAWIQAPKTDPIDSKIADNIYTVGTHTGQSDQAFTTMESAIQNAVHLGNQLTFNNTTIKSKKSTSLIFVICMILIMLLIIIATLSFEYKHIGEHFGSGKLET